MLINSWNEDDWNRGQARKKDTQLCPFYKGMPSQAQNKERATAVDKKGIT